MANDKAEPSEVSLVGRKAAAPREAPLGGFLTEARKRRGLSAEDLVRQTRIPAHYVRMIENDDYGLIADQLYVLPFLRRYATFVGLEAEEVVTRFVREVQRADSYASKMSEPIPVVERTKGRTRIAALALATVIVLAAVTYLAVSRRHRGPASAAPSSSAVVSPKPSTSSQASAPAVRQNSAGPNDEPAPSDDTED